MKVCCNKCKYVWNYKGGSVWYVTCPRCYTKVKSMPFLKHLQEQKRLKKAKFKGRWIDKFSLTRRKKDSKGES